MLSDIFSTRLNRKRIKELRDTGDEKKISQAEKLEATKIAIEIGRRYRFSFLKLMAKYGYSLHSMRRGDSENTIITLERVSNAVFAN